MACSYNVRWSLTKPGGELRLSRQSNISLSPCHGPFYAPLEVCFEPCVSGAGGTVAKVIADLVARGASPAFIRVVAAVVTPQAMRLLNDKFPGALPGLARRGPHLCHTQPRPLMLQARVRAITGCTWA